MQGLWVIICKAAPMMPGNNTMRDLIPMYMHVCVLAKVLCLNEDERHLSGNLFVSYNYFDSSNPNLSQFNRVNTLWAMI